MILEESLLLANEWLSVVIIAYPFILTGNKNEVDLVINSNIFRLYKSH